MVWYKLEPSELEFAQRAPFYFHNETILPIPPQQTFEILASDSWLDWFPDFKAITWLSEPPYGVGSKREVTMKALGARERFLAWDPGKRLSFSLDEVTLPLVTAMMEDLQLEPAEPDQTRLIYRVYYRPVLWVRPLHPIIRILFAKMFRQGVKNLEEYVRRKLKKNTVPNLPQAEA